jgi:hypothetical protein
MLPTITETNRIPKVMGRMPVKAGAAASTEDLMK